MMDTPPGHINCPDSSLERPAPDRRGKERAHTVEDPAQPPDDRPRKRRRAPSDPSAANNTSGQEAEGARLPVDPIDHWRKEGNWPPEYFEDDITQRDDIMQRQDVMQRLLARRKSKLALRCKQSDSSLSGTPSDVTPSDQKPREEKSAPYRDSRYKVLLETKGSYMDRSTLDITDTSKALCQRLLEEAQTPPRDSLFRDDIFESTCRMLADRNEARVTRDITPLIVPSAEVLTIYGATGLACLIESLNEGWNNSLPLTAPRPQPDYSVGFRRAAFTDEQLDKMSPAIGDWYHGDQSLFLATYTMFFPFLSCEVKCGAQALDIADRQNAHSMTLATRAIVELFRAVGREDEVHRQILAFSVSHDNRSVRIFGHYPVIDGNDTKYYRHPIDSFDILNGREKWTAYRFTKNVYDLWMPGHLQRIRSAIDQLPSGMDHEASISEAMGGG